MSRSSCGFRAGALAPSFSLFRRRTARRWPSCWRIEGMLIAEKPKHPRSWNSVALWSWPPLRRLSPEAAVRASFITCCAWSVSWSASNSSKATPRLSAPSSWARAAGVASTVLISRPDSSMRTSFCRVLLPVPASPVQNTIGRQSSAAPSTTHPIQPSRSLASSSPRTHSQLFRWP